MDEILKKIKQFHGHLGPYVVLGYRMGLICNQKFGNNPFSKKATVYTGSNPPVSCIIDGVQMSSGCTLGKGNIKIINENMPRVCFSNNDEGRIDILLKKNIQKDIDNNLNEENMEEFSRELFQKTDDELFDIFLDL